MGEAAVKSVQSRAAEAEAEERRKQRNDAQREKRNAEGGWAKLLANSVSATGTGTATVAGLSERRNNGTS